MHASRSLPNISEPKRTQPPYFHGKCHVATRHPEPMKTGSGPVILRGASRSRIEAGLCLRRGARMSKLAGISCPSEPVAPGDGEHVGETAPSHVDPPRS